MGKEQLKELVKWIDSEFEEFSKVSADAEIKTEEELSKLFDKTPENKEFAELFNERFNERIGKNRNAIITEATENRKLVEQLRKERDQNQKMQEESVDDNLSHLEKDIKYCLESKKGRNCDGTYPWGGFTGKCTQLKSELTKLLNKGKVNESVREKYLKILKRLNEIQRGK